jgi:hypothetical protein
MPKNPCSIYFTKNIGSPNFKFNGGGSCARKDHIGMYRM